MVIILSVFAAIAVLLVVAYVASTAARTGVLDPSAQTPQTLNHREMARLLERIVRDDYLRPQLSNDDRELARRLLTDYFGDAPKELE